MRKWKVKISKYKGHIKVVIPGELSKLAILHRYEYLEMSLDKTGKIIMEAFDARGHRKVEGSIDKVGFN